MNRGPDIAIKADVVLEQYRCGECGRYWAIERYVSSECPHCAAVLVSKLHDTIEKLGRSISSLRGALTRKRGRR